MPGSRTGKKIIRRMKEVIFDAGNFQSMLDLREQRDLEDSMGFRGQWENHRLFQIEVLRRLGLRPDHSFLELGCGPMTAGVPLIQYLDANKYTGIDIRGSVLNMSWREVGKAGLSAKNPRLIRSETFGSDVLSSDQRFDFVYSFSVLYHLSDEILDNYFSVVSKRLKVNGICIANVNTTIPSDNWLEFPFVQRGIESYRSIAFKHGLSTKDLGTIQELGFSGTGIERANPLLLFTTQSS